MVDLTTSTARRIDPETALARWEQGQALTQLFTEIWLSNPALAKKAGLRVQEFVMPLAEVQRRHLGDLS